MIGAWVSGFPRRKRNEPENVFLNTKGAKKKNYKCADEASERERERECGKRERRRGEEIIRESFDESGKAEEEGREESKDLACNNVPR